jgi:hypothetical protein
MKPISLTFNHRLAPPTVILTPATLTVEPFIMTNETTCSSVRTLNFTPETVNDWREPKKISGLYELSLSFWNTTSTNVSDPNFFDYYTGPSQPLQQIATLSAYLQRTVVQENASVDICGAGWNCTGPGYKCSNQTRDVGSNDGGLTVMRKRISGFFFPISDKIKSWTSNFWLTLGHLQSPGVCSEHGYSIVF